MNSPAPGQTFIPHDLSAELAFISSVGACSIVDLLAYESALATGGGRYIQHPMDKEGEAWELKHSK